MIQDFYGYKYDEEKLNKYEEKVEEKEEENWDMIPQIEEIALEEDGRDISLATCACCGRIIQNSYFGYGKKCFGMVLKSISLIAKISPNFEKLLSEYNFKKYRYFAQVVKNVYIDINSNKDGQLKKFKSEFKKSFTQSIINSERISRKQLNVMIKDIGNQNYYNSDKIEYNEEFIWSILEENKMQAIKMANHKRYEELVNDFENLLNVGDVTTFVRITYCKAWIDNPFENKVA